MEFGTQKSRKLVADSHELVRNLVGNRICDHVCDLDSVWNLAYTAATQITSAASVLLAYRGNGSAYELN